MTLPPAPGTRRDVIAIGGSAGGIEALIRVLRGLPAELGASVLVTIHIPAHVRSALPEILARSTSLRVAHAKGGEHLEKGRVYVCPPDHHLLLRGDILELSRGPRENGHRPAVDPMFRSVAVSRGPRSIGVVLSGLLDDGTEGLVLLKLQGGATVVQAPQDARYASMPESAISHVQPEHVVSADEIGEVLVALCSEPIPDADLAPANAAERWSFAPEAPPEQVPLEIAAEVDAAKRNPGPPAPFSCPLCHGPLTRVEGSDLVRYVCRVGHAYGEQSLLAAQLESVEEAMWTAYRILAETAAMSHRLAEQSRRRGLDAMADRHDARAADALKRANLIRRTLEDDPTEHFR